MSRRSALLELAVLGLLHDSPMHGYELRKRLNAVLGAFRPLSYGTLYPCLRDLLRPRLDRRGLRYGASVARRADQPAGPDRLRADGRRQGALPVADLASPGPAAWEDDDVRRALRLLLPHRGRGAAAHPRGPAQPARGAARRRSAPPRPGAASAWTSTPPSCSGTAWTRPSARCAGSPS